MRRARYSRRDWVLTLCVECARARYCEPHGTTADCSHCKRATESASIPYRYGDAIVSLTAADRRSIVSVRS